MANMELEYKFGLPNNWSHFTLTNYDLIRGHIVDLKHFGMESDDFDTEDAVLDRGGHSLRRRSENGRCVYTLKVLREDNGDGKRVRSEYEVFDNVSLKAAVDQMFLEATQKDDDQCKKLIARMAAPMVNDDLTAHLMKYRTRAFVRYEYTIDFRDVTIAIAVDIGIKIFDGGSPNERTERIRKIDLEYKDGNPATFEKYVDAFEFCTGLRRITEAKVTDLNYDL